MDAMSYSYHPTWVESFGAFLVPQPNANSQPREIGRQQALECLLAGLLFEARRCWRPKVAP